MSPEGGVEGGLLRVVVVQASGCGRNEWNATFGGSSDEGG